MEKLLTIDDLAKMLSVSKSTIYRWVHYGFVPHFKIGGAVRFDEGAIQRWLREREVAGRRKIALDIN